MTAVNGAQIRGWITPRLEEILHRAAAISVQHDYGYLAVEHVVLALLDEGESVPMRLWQGSMTADKWRQAIFDALPDAPIYEGAPPDPVHVEVTRQQPEDQRPPATG